MLWYPRQQRLAGFSFGRRVKPSCVRVKTITGEMLREALKAFGISQMELARAAERCEATISRQLNGSLPLSERVVGAAEGLLVQRGAQVAGRILEWVETRRSVAASRKGAEGRDDA